jgi:hypothetical protein
MFWLFTLLALSFCMLEEGCCVGKIVIVVAGVSLVVCISPRANHTYAA